MDLMELNTCGSMIFKKTYTIAISRVMESSVESARNRRGRSF